jgi:ATP-dependent RNA helicase DeaD
MGREGIAFTFVTPEQGIELTRIEMLINKLLAKDEIEGFIAVAQVAPPQAPAGPVAFGPGIPSAPSVAAPPSEAPPKPAAAPPPGKRMPRRHRRAL